MSVPMDWFVVSLVVAALLGYYSAVVFNRPFEGDVGFDDNQVDSNDTSKCYEITVPKNLNGLFFKGLIYLDPSKLAEHDTSKCPAFTLVDGYITVRCETASYRFRADLFSREQISVYVQFVKALETAHPIYLFSDIPSFTGGFTQEYGITSKYDEKLSELVENTDPSGQSYVEGHQIFLYTYARSRFLVLQEIIENNAAKYSDQDLVNEFKANAHLPTNSLLYCSLNAEIDRRVTKKEDLERADKLLLNAVEEIEKLTLVK